MPPHARSDIHHDPRITTSAVRPTLAVIPTVTSVTKITAPRNDKECWTAYSVRCPRRIVIQSAAMGRIRSIPAELPVVNPRAKRMSAQPTMCLPHHGPTASNALRARHSCCDPSVAEFIPTQREGPSRWMMTGKHDDQPWPAYSGVCQPHFVIPSKAQRPEESLVADPQAGKTGVLPGYFVGLRSSSGDSQQAIPKEWSGCGPFAALRNDKECWPACTLGWTRQIVIPLHRHPKGAQR